MLRTASVRGDEGQVDLSLHGGGKLDLGFLCRIAKALKRHLIAFAAQIQPFFLLKLLYQPFHNALVNVVATQVGITIGGLHLNHAFADFQNRNIEGAAAEVVYSDSLVFLLVQAVGQSSRRRLIDDALHIQAGNLTGVFGGLALRIIKVGWDGNHRFGDGLAQIVFRRLLQLLQNHGRDLRRSVFLRLRHNGHMVALAGYLVRDHLHLVVYFFVTASHESLDGVNSVFRVSDGLAFCHLSNQALARFRKPNHRRGGPAAFFVLNDLGFAAFHHGYHRVCGTQVNSYDFAHG